MCECVCVNVCVRECASRGRGRKNNDVCVSLCSRARTATIDCTDIMYYYLPRAIMIHFYNEIVKLSKAKNFHRTAEYDNIIVCRYYVYIIRARELCSVVLYIIPCCYCLLIRYASAV